MLGALELLLGLDLVNDLVEKVLGVINCGSIGGGFPCDIVPRCFQVDQIVEEVEELATRSVRNACEVPGLQREQEVERIAFLGAQVLR